MRIRLNLTILSDLDLITLYHIPEFDFKIWVRNALRLYAEDRTVLKTPLPAPPESISPENMMLSITFDPFKDAKVLKWLNSLHDYQRSSAIKSLLRCCLNSPCLYAFHSDFPTLFPSRAPERRKKSRKTSDIPDFVDSSSIPVYSPSETFSAENQEGMELDDFDIFSFPTEE